MSVSDQHLAVAAFYRFEPLAGLEALRDRLKALCEAAGARGILLLAPEGLNGTLAAPSEAMDGLLAGIRVAAGLSGLEPRRSHATAPPFKRLKVRIKKEAVTIGDPAVDPRRRVGTYVDPSDWNAVIADPDVLVIDTRNAFEVAFGTFEGAIDPGIARFGDFPEWVGRTLDPRRHRKVAMFCTGGIRCEKASSYMLDAGFEEVLHLKGGILAYLDDIAPAQSRWTGGCFVFDERVALGHGLAPIAIRNCLSCDAPLDDAARAAPGYEEGVSCPRCVDRLSARQKASARERQRQVAAARDGS
jgi:UPF0176 protein